MDEYDENEEFEMTLDGDIQSYINSYANLIRKTEELASKIIRMNNKGERERLLHDFFALTGYLKMIGLCPVSDAIDYISDELEDCYYTKSSINELTKIDEFCNNAELLDQFNDNLINEYEKNGYYCNRAYIPCKVNEEKYNIALLNFFKYLGDDVYNLYCKMINENHIAYVNNLCEMGAGGMTYLSRQQEDSYIFVDNTPNDLHEVMYLCHEVGHAYQTYLLKCQDNNKLSPFYVEFFSQLFEKMFIKYLRDNDLFNDSVDNYRLERYLMLYYQTKVSSALTKLVKDEKVNVFNIFYGDYDIDTLEEIEDEYIKTNAIKNKGINWMHQIYVIDSSIGEYFFRLMERDFNKGYSAAKNFILTASDYSLKENLEKYVSDLTPTNEEMKEAIESVRVKKYMKK